MKLSAHGVGGKALAWVKNLLRNRRQRVVVDKKSSE